MLTIKQQKHSVWMSLSDLMAVLMVLFLFISIGFVLELQRQQAAEVETQSQLQSLLERVLYEEEERENHHKALNQALHDEFADDLERWSAEITEDNIMRFDAPFAVGRAELSPVFEEVLTEFFPRYLGVLGNQQFKNRLQEVRIEGHTSNTWAQAETAYEVYLNNMRLSQQRASNVLEYVYRIDHPQVHNLYTWLERHLRANGMAYANPLLQADGTTLDPVRSRRVEFKVVTRDFFDHN
ncbi:MAG: hypothetical protein IBX50_16000 [Marinospirillum sp.]|uniref:OmpA family protein n=1 Tax=Marinospirillum sp. TaxID=2183934 RepID=UPI0019F436FF|nr:OmpA family protein [Marinospirillum sp.]MBE0508193.1 hypothetical protein [Marinospirillum sp.]